MAKRAFITGITGQDGSYLARLLLKKGYQVHGGQRRTSTSATGRLDELGIADDITIHDLDLIEVTNIQRVLDKVAPDEIYNLAAQSYVGTSFEQPIYTAEIDALGPMRLLECMRQSGAKARFYQASTSEMFGKVLSAPQNETTPFHPRSPYGVAKLFGHWATVNYREAFDLFACSGILFNHESPLRGIQFVTRKITLGFARIRRNRQEVVELGNLEARRDWGFAGDYVEGIWSMLQRDSPDDFVLATGETHSIRQFAELAAEAFGWTLAWRGSGFSEEGFDQKSGRVLVRINPAMLRPAEVDVLTGDPAKAERMLGWRRRVPFPGLVNMMAEADDRRLDDPGTLQHAAHA
jgi:GDPmannose 4,6-dehydratase